MDNKYIKIEEGKLILKCDILNYRPQVEGVQFSFSNGRFSIESDSKIGGRNDQHVLSDDEVALIINYFTTRN